MTGFEILHKMTMMDVNFDYSNHNSDDDDWDGWLVTLQEILDDFDDYNPTPRIQLSVRSSVRPHF